MTYLVFVGKREGAMLRGKVEAPSIDAAWAIARDVFPQADGTRGDMIGVRPVASADNTMDIRERAAMLAQVGRQLAAMMMCA